ncbi:hypothetical protein F1640_11255 [Novosphingobium sp. NBM11]|uniref:hypothetical protein n=1 Tax=Novosphingobium sp. NBM11 TaxID=2596914 RepID=UPI0018920B04|nr:hypothetical protein [Novosphingobium sp. NBM11]MBF5090580.1 hypothetical protein [Novosphingobium sp. NBM11]
MAKFMFCLALLLGGFSSATAQDRRASTDAVVGFFGVLAKGIAQADVRSSWNAVPDETRSCLDTAFSPKNANVEGLIRSGVKANDPRLSELMNFCQAVMSRQLRNNFPCNTPNGAGQNVETLCYEQFVSTGNGEVRPLDRDAFIRLAASGGAVQIATLEIPAARSSRLQVEQRAREMEAQRAKLAQQQAMAERQRLAEQKALEDKKKAVADLSAFRPY